MNNLCTYLKDFVEIFVIVDTVRVQLPLAIISKIPVRAAVLPLSKRDVPAKTPIVLARRFDLSPL